MANNSTKTPTAHMPQSLVNRLNLDPSGWSIKVNKALFRYFQALSVTRIKSRFTDQEFAAILSSSIGYHKENPANLSGVVFADVVIAMDRLVSQYEINKDVLLTKLKSMSYIDELALIDSIEQTKAYK